MGSKTKEVRVGVRSGAGHDPTSNGGFRRVRVAVVSGGARPMLWLGGARQCEGVAWVSGRDTLRRIRDALTAALSEGDPT